VLSEFCKFFYHFSRIVEHAVCVCCVFVAEEKDRVKTWCVQFVVAAARKEKSQSLSIIKKPHSMGRKKRNTVQTISNAIARIVLASGTQNAAGAAGGSNSGGTCIRVASAGTHQRYYEKHQKGASDALKETAAKLFCTPASDVIIAGSPSASSVVNAFEAASVHSELGRMLKSFAAATVDLFVKGPESVLDFAEKWIAQMSSSSAQKHLYELQGFGTLFSFLFYQLIQARKKYLDALKKATLPNSVEAIDVLMQTLSNMREVLLESSSDEECNSKDAASGADSDVECSLRPHSQRRQQRLAAAAAGEQRRHQQQQPPADTAASGVSAAETSPVKGSSSLTPQQPAVSITHNDAEIRSVGGRAPRRQGPLYSSGSFEVGEANPLSRNATLQQQHQQTTQLATSVFQFGGGLEGGGGGGDRRGRREKLPRMPHQSSTAAPPKNDLIDPTTSGAAPSHNALQVPQNGIVSDQRKEPLAVALTATGLLSLVQQHGGSGTARSITQTTGQSSTNDNDHYSQAPHQFPYSLHAQHQRLHPIGGEALHVGVAAVKSAPLSLQEPSPTYATGLIGGHPHKPHRPLVLYSTTGHPNTHQLPAYPQAMIGSSNSGHPPPPHRLYPQPFNGPPLPLTARVTRDQHHSDSSGEVEPYAHSARGSGGWKQYWEQEENKKLEQTISGCRGLVNYGKQRDLDQYGRELEALRRQVYGEDDDDVGNAAEGNDQHHSSSSV
jgi:hypothetical protein